MHNLLEQLSLNLKIARSVMDLQPTNQNWSFAYFNCLSHPCFFFSFWAEHSLSKACSNIKAAPVWGSSNFTEASLTAIIMRMLYEYLIIKIWKESSSSHDPSVPWQCSSTALSNITVGCGGHKQLLYFLECIYLSIMPIYADLISHLKIVWLKVNEWPNSTRCF